MISFNKGIILYAGKAKDSTKNLLELIQKNCNLAYKINSPNLDMLLCTKSYQLEKEFKKIIPLTIAPQTIKY